MATCYLLRSVGMCTISATVETMNNRVRTNRFFSKPSAFRKGTPISQISIASLANPVNAAMTRLSLRN
jgi:hypothetical protein